MDICIRIITISVSLITSDILIYGIQTKIFKNQVPGPNLCNQCFNNVTHQNVTVKCDNQKNSFSEVFDLCQIGRNVAILLSNYSSVSKRVDHAYFELSLENRKIKRNFIGFKYFQLDHSSINVYSSFNFTINGMKDEISSQRETIKELKSLMNKQQEECAASKSELKSKLDAVQEDFHARLGNMETNYLDKVNEVNNLVNKERDEFIVFKNETNLTLNNQRSYFTVIVNNLSADVREKIEELSSTIKKQQEELTLLKSDHENKINELNDVMSKLHTMENSFKNLHFVQDETSRLTDVQSYFIIGFAVFFFIIMFVIWKLYHNLIYLQSSSQVKPNQMLSELKTQAPLHICCFVTNEERLQFCQNQVIPKLENRFPGLRTCSLKATSVDEAEKLPSAALYLLFVSEDARGLILESSSRSLRRFALHKIRKEFCRPVFLIISEYNRKDSAREGRLYNESLSQIKSDPDLQELALQRKIFSYCDDLRDEHLTCLFDYVSSYLPIN